MNTNLTPAERHTARGRCVVCGQSLVWRGARRVMVIARPPGVSGGYASYVTPHKTCGGCSEAIALTVELVLRESEQALLRARAEVAHGWRDALLSVATEIAP